MVVDAHFKFRARSTQYVIFFQRTKQERRKNRCWAVIMNYKKKESSRHSWLWRPTLFLKVFFSPILHTPTWAVMASRYDMLSHTQNTFKIRSGATRWWWRKKKRKPIQSRWSARLFGRFEFGGQLIESDHKIAPNTFASNRFTIIKTCIYKYTFFIHRFFFLVYIRQTPRCGVTLLPTKKKQQLDNWCCFVNIPKKKKSTRTRAFASLFLIASRKTGWILHYQDQVLFHQKFKKKGINRKGRNKVGRRHHDGASLVARADWTRKVDWQQEDVLKEMLNGWMNIPNISANYSSSWRMRLFRPPPEFKQEFSGIV